jgi:hypothetical protein
LKSPPPPYIFIPQFPIQEIVSIVSFFHLHSCVHSICNIFIFTPFPHHLPVPLVLTPSGSFAPLVLQFWKRNDIFACLRLLHREFPCGTSIYIYMYYSLIWFSMILAIGVYSLYYVAVHSFLVSSEVLSWKDVEFCWKLFLHLLRWSCGFCLCFC